MLASLQMLTAVISFGSPLKEPQCAHSHAAALMPRMQERYYKEKLHIDSRDESARRGVMSAFITGEHLCIA